MNAGGSLMWFPSLPFSIWIDYDNHPFAPWVASILLYTVFQAGPN
jgi:hypothetical protein